MRPRPRASGPSSGSGTRASASSSKPTASAKRCGFAIFQCTSHRWRMPCCVDALAVKLIGHEAARHFGLADIAEIVEARADPRPIGGADEHVDVGSNAPRGIGIDVVGERRAFHQEHVEASAAVSPRRRAAIRRAAPARARPAGVLRRADRRRAPAASDRAPSAPTLACNRPRNPSAQPLPGTQRHRCPAAAAGAPADDRNAAAARRVTKYPYGDCTYAPCGSVQRRRDRDIDWRP